MRNYEIMYILKADLDEAARNEEMEKVHALLTANGAKINNVDKAIEEIEDKIKLNVVGGGVDGKAMRYGMLIALDILQRNIGK